MLAMVYRILKYWSVNENKGESVHIYVWGDAVTTGGEQSNGSLVQWFVLALSSVVPVVEDIPAVDKCDASGCVASSCNTVTTECSVGLWQTLNIYYTIWWESSKWNLLRIWDYLVQALSTAAANFAYTASDFYAFYVISSWSIHSCYFFIDSTKGTIKTHVSVNMECWFTYLLYKMATQAMLDVSDGTTFYTYCSAIIVAIQLPQVLAVQM